MSALLLNYYIQRFARYFYRRRLAKIITAALLVAVFAAVAVGIFFFVRSGLKLTIQVPYFKEALPLYIYELFLLIISFLVLFSAAITGLFTLFRSSGDEWVLASKRFTAMPAYAGFRMFASSAWPFLVVALPALAAIQSVFSIGPVKFLAAFAALLLYTAALAAAAFILVLGGARVLSLLRTKRGSMLTFPRLAGAVLLVILIFAGASWNWAFSEDVVALLSAENISAETAPVEPVIRAFEMFPSHPLALLLFKLQTKDIADALAEIGLVAALFAAGIIVSIKILQWHLPLWQALQEGAFEAKTARRDGGATARAPAGRRPKRTFRFKTPLRAILAKEALIMARDMKNLLWLGFLFVLLTIQTGLNFVIAKNVARHAIDPASFPEIVGVLQFATLVYFMGTFAVRFALPAWSSELKTAWIMASAPVDQGKLFRAKFLFFGTTFLAVGFAASAVNFFVLPLPIALLGATALLFGTAIIFLTALGLALGAFFPNFDTDDPQVISTSLPGVAFILAALSYGAAGAWLLHIAGRDGALLPLAAFTAASLGATAALAAAAPRALRRLEYAKDL